jgi:hypothetical protein
VPHSPAPRGCRMVREARSGSRPRLTSAQSGEEAAALDGGAAQLTALLCVVLAVLGLRGLCAMLVYAQGGESAFAWRREFRRGPQYPVYMVRRQLLRSPWVDVYVNEIRTPDFDSNPHNHPWRRSYSLKLRRSYVERIYWGQDLAFQYLRRPRLWSRIPAIHRIETLPLGSPAWTLFVGIGRTRKWGFYDLENGGRFVAHDEYAADRADTLRSNEL